MRIYKRSSGLIFDDTMGVPHDRWTFIPHSSGSYTSRPGYLRMLHSTIQDRFALFDLPPGDCVIDIFADYFPVDPTDRAGLVLWQDSVTRAELLESADLTMIGDFVKWRAIKIGDSWNLYAKRTDTWYFIDTVQIPAVKAGIVVKKGEGPDLVPLDCDRVVVCCSRYLQVGNILPGYTVTLYSPLEVPIASKVVEPTFSGVEIELPALAYEGIIKIHDTESDLVGEMQEVFYGGDLYYHGTYLQVLDTGVELLRSDHNNLGVMRNGIIQKKLQLYNPSDSLISEHIELSIIQYNAKFGYQWASVAPDIYGSSGPPIDKLNIPSLGPGVTIDFWLQVEQGEDYMGIAPLYFILDIIHN